jgi:hypothetical protein
LLSIAVKTIGITIDMNTGPAIVAEARRGFDEDHKPANSPTVWWSARTKLLSTQPIR